jgi:hypothetical protein
VTLQLALLPAEQLKSTRMVLTAEQLHGYELAQPSAELFGLVRDLGLLQPPFASSLDGQDFTLVEGRRRTKVVFQLIESGQWPGQTGVECDTYTGPEAADPAKMAAVALALHAARRASVATELGLIEQIIAANPEIPEDQLLAQIAAQTTMVRPTIARRLRLRKLIAELRDAFERGEISDSTAEAAARLPDSDQQRLVEALAAGEKVTASTVRAMKSARRSAASAALPGHLFNDPEPPWSVTVSGHIAAAIAATPDGKDTAELANALQRTGALAALH